MLAINSISPNFKTKPSCSKLATQKAERFSEILQKTLAKKDAATKILPDNKSFTIMTKTSLVDINEIISSQAAKEYKITSQKFAEQKGAKLFQEV